MEEVKFEFTDEQREQLRKLIADINEKMQACLDIVAEIVQAVMEKIREWAEKLARFFLKQQLLEWRIPNSAADFISEKIHWSLAFKLGFRWVNRQMQMIR